MLGRPASAATKFFASSAVARVMIAMTQRTNEDWKAHVGDTGVTCYTCHRGKNVP